MATLKKQNVYHIINAEVQKKISTEAYELVPDSELKKILSEVYHFCDTLIVENKTSLSTPVKLINHTNTFCNKTNTSISYQ